MADINLTWDRESGELLSSKSVVGNRYEDRVNRFMMPSEGRWVLRYKIGLLVKEVDFNRYAWITRDMTMYRELLIQVIDRDTGDYSNVCKVFIGEGLVSEDVIINDLLRFDYYLEDGIQRELGYKDDLGYWALSYDYHEDHFDKLPNRFLLRVHTVGESVVEEIICDRKLVDGNYINYGEVIRGGRVYKVYNDVELTDSGELLYVVGKITILIEGLTGYAEKVIVSIKDLSYLDITEVQASNFREIFFEKLVWESWGDGYKAEVEIVGFSGIYAFINGRVMGYIEEEQDDYRWELTDIGRELEYEVRLIGGVWKLIIIDRRGYRFTKYKVSFGFGGMDSNIRINGVLGSDFEFIFLNQGKPGDDY